jgi:16S rRNA (uracil1498-N3)-methyltransferase
MRRFFIEEIEERDGHVVISGAEARHISKVLRMRRGDHFILMDGKGNRFEAVIEISGPKELYVKLESPLPSPPESLLKISLCQALLKSRSMDYLIEKTSELGMYEFIPFFSKRTVVKLDAERAAAKTSHWQEIAKSAAKQSDRMKPAEIFSPIPFRELADKWKKSDGVKVVLWEKEAAEDLKKLLENSTSINKFIGMVGPEGGFTSEEIEIAKGAGFIPVSLGRRILRAETAAITMIAILQYEFGDLSLRGRC